MPSLYRPLSLADHHIGSLDAAVTIVEYGDYECTSCAAAYAALQTIYQEDQNGICVVFRHFPLSKLHDRAMDAAIAAEAAGKFDLFWEMHNKLFTGQAHLNRNDLVQYAEEIGIEANVFLSEFQSPEHSEHIRADFLAGVKSGVNRTPALFINRQRVDTESNYESLLAAIINARELGDTEINSGTSQ